MHHHDMWYDWLEDNWLCEDKISSIVDWKRICSIEISGCGRDNSRYLCEEPEHGRQLRLFLVKPRIDKFWIFSLNEMHDCFNSLSNLWNSHWKFNFKFDLSPTNNICDTKRITFRKFYRVIVKQSVERQEKCGENSQENSIHTSNIFDSIHCLCDFGVCMLA